MSTSIMVHDAAAITRCEVTMQSRCDEAFRGCVPSDDCHFVQFVH
jgi:hypothetical protein